MNLTLFGLGWEWEQEAAIRDLFEAHGWDYHYVHELSLLSLPNLDVTLFTRNSLGRMAIKEIPGSGRNCTGNFGPC